MLAAGNEAAEAARYLTAATRERLPLAVAGIDEALAPASPEGLVEALTRALALIAGAINQDAREEWIAAAYDELKHLPADLVLEALGNARRHCDHMSKIVPFVEKACAGPLAERRTQKKLLDRLAKAAESPALAEQTPEEKAALQADIDGLLQRLKNRRVADEPPPPIASADERRSYRQTQPAYDGTAQQVRDLDTLNFVRRSKGEPALTIDEYRAQLRASLKASLGGDALDADVAAVFDGKE